MDDSVILKLGHSGTSTVGHNGIAAVASKFIQAPLRVIRKRSGRRTRHDPQSCSLASLKGKGSEALGFGLNEGHSLGRCHSRGEL